MATNVPAMMKAVIIEEGHRIAIKDHPVPKLGDNDILVKTAAIALNPTDWIHVDLIGTPGSILGCDYSGTVVQVGKAVSHPAVGAHVAGYMHAAAAFPDEGSFAEYVKAPANLVFVVPDGTFSHEESATLGCAFWTAVQALFNTTRLGLVEPPAKVTEDEWILIYGGSTAVGQSAIRLAALAGYKVVTTASPRNFDLVKSLGASAAFDYRAPDVVAQIKAATGDSLKKALDAAGSGKDSQGNTAEALGPSGGKVILVSPSIPGATSRTDVESQSIFVYTSLGRPVNFGDVHVPVIEADVAHMAAFLAKLPQLVKDGLVKPLPIRLWEGGFAAVPDGLQYMREGKVSAEKIVYRV